LRIVVLLEGGRDRILRSVCFRCKHSFFRRRNEVSALEKPRTNKLRLVWIVMMKLLIEVGLTVVDY
jgi:hypothetical protein